MTHSLLRPLLAALLPLSLGACSSLQSSDNFLGVITPYRVEVVQGNVVTKEQAALIKPGMSRSQVRDLLGSPLLADIFHADRWDYVFTIRRRGAEPQQRNVMVLFQDDKVSKFEAAELPSEREFVNALSSAEQIARPLGDEYVSTEHLLAGLARVGGAVGRMLKQAGATEESLIAAE